MRKPQRTTVETFHRLPVILQNLPDLRYDDDDWTSQKARRIAVGSISVRTLADLFKVDRLVPANPDGYQRLPTENRVKSLKRDLAEERVDLPTAILLNLRQFDEQRNLDRSAAPLTELTLQSDDKLYVVDGQHRVEALVGLYKENAERWGDYSIPFVCLLGADRDGEMTEFYVVNDNAKSIGTALAYELIKRRAENSKAARAHLVETGKAWVKSAGVLTDKLAKTGIWRDRIQTPGQKKSGTLITSNGMTTSLRPLVEQPGFFQSIADADQQVNVLNAYWEGIKTVAPEAMEDPEKYNLQRTLGVVAMHAVLLNVLAITVSNGSSVFDSARYAEIMKEPLRALGGYNKQGEWVEGNDFWKRGNEGASGLYSSRSGYRILQAQITENLPGINVQ